MQFKLDVQPDLVALMKVEIEAGERAVTAAMGQAGLGLKSAWRAQITGADLGQRLANTIRNQTYPKAGVSLNAAALVWSQAPVIIGAHEKGALIRGRSGLWLAIPLPAAGKAARGARITPAQWEKKTGLRLRLVPRRTGPSLLVAEARVSAKGLAKVSRSKTGRGLATVPVFLLVRQVKLSKRLDLVRDALAAQSRLPDEIALSWDLRSG